MATYRVRWTEEVVYEAEISATSVEQMMDKWSSGMFDGAERSVWVETVGDSLDYETVQA